jgi:L-ascorbate metabolism protein UlaG (beta-lactamase superfamily)
MEITWITQGGFIFEHRGRRLVVDPYLSDAAEKALNWTRLVPPPVDVNNLRPDTVFCSHDHIDHLDPEAVPRIDRIYPSCDFMGPESVTDCLRQMRIDPKKLNTLNAGMRAKTEGFQLVATPAYHSDPHAVGIVIQADQKTIYVSGDTRYQLSLAKEVEACAGADIDLVLICINGKMNNMGDDEAVKVVQHLQPRIASPMHYGLFAENTVDPEPFAHKCRSLGIRSFLFSVGKPINLDKLLCGVDNEDS